MKKNFIILLGFIALFMVSCKNNNNEVTDRGPITPQGSTENIIPDQYIIALDPEFIKPAHDRLDWSKIKTRQDKKQQMDLLNKEVAEQINNWLQNAGITNDQVLGRLTALSPGVALKINKATMERLGKLPEVKSIEYNRTVKLPDYKVDVKDTGGADAQMTPCGITNAGGFANAGLDRWIYIVDSGIDLDHPDLNVADYVWAGISTIPDEPSPDDCDGHGTHVAGTAAAKNNNIGVVGVAAGAPLVPIRVFSCEGETETIYIIQGIQHISNSCLAGDVCNMSLGGYFGPGCGTYATMYGAVNALNNLGVRFSISAGNFREHANLYEPACLNFSRVYTVAAMTCNKIFDNSYSNYGRPPVDWVATGTGVRSTYVGGYYATLTGTSMAAPHVAGIMQLRNGPPVSGGNITDGFSNTNYPIAKR